MASNYDKTQKIKQKLKFNFDRDDPTLRVGVTVSSSMENLSQNSPQPKRQERGSTIDKLLFAAKAIKASMDGSCMMLPIYSVIIVNGVNFSNLAMNQWIGTLPMEARTIS